MADPIGEIKEALERLVEQKTLSVNASLGLAPGNQTLAPPNPNTGGVDLEDDQSFTTGYDGTNTMLPFMRGLSSWDTDTWTE